ncbi:carbon storage regulator [Lacipirellula parvula]|uniref:Translational regulator CsrA n=1 Tax=Lacipirellula parvula TaxID=2650471 RepID=A0A5K7X4W5_9BACT|nr:carbon storage regulator [Lacipirellula parvula]BBO31435.1 carbon storage regulator [Lacipirellula parvula]
MLVLSRKQSQRIKLGDSIVITVVRVAGDKVRLGIDAPRDMLVLRDELEPHDGAGLEIEVAAGELASLARSA